MKKRNLNKVIIFTLCCIIVSATVVNAKTIKSKACYQKSMEYVDPHPWDEGGRT